MIITDDVKKAGRVIPMNAIIAKHKMKRYLDAKQPELVLFLQTLWNNQQKAITYKEIREAIMAGYLSEKLMEEWFQDYSRFVIEKVAPIWQDAMKEANKAFQSALPKYIYNPMQEGVVNWTNERAAMFVTNVTRDQVAAMREVIKRAHQLHDMNVDELSRAIRPMVGLDYRQAIANTNYYENMIKNGLKPEVALDKSIKYSARQNRHRAYRISRTEIGFAYNQGTYFGTKQAQEQGLLGECVKVWCTADSYYSDGRRRTCDTCHSLDGKEIAMDDEFYYEYEDKEGNIQTRRINPKLTGDTIGRVPPAHPHCMCTVLIKEISPPIQTIDPSYIEVQ